MLHSDAMLTPCPSCRRHVAAADTDCPFCGAHVTHVAQPAFARASRAQLLVVAAAVAVSGCEKKSEPEVTNVATEKSVASPTPSPSPSVVASAEPSPSTIASLGGLQITPGLTGTGMAAAYGAPPTPGLGELKLPKGEVATSPATGDVANVKDADKVIAAARARFRTCYAKALAQDPAAEGKMTLTIGVGAAGEVTDAKVASSTAPAPLGACVAAVSRGLRFSAPAKPATISVPLSFTTKS